MSQTRSATGSRFPLPSRFQLTITAVLVVAVAGVGTIAIIHKGSTSTPEAASLARDDFMGLSPAGNVSAPDITLADQNGQTVSLAGLEQQGKVVVLEFMDSHCTDICPIVSDEFRVAAKQLGPAEQRVAFVAVNVNPFYAGQSDVAAFTQEHGLFEVPGWHFLTGPVPQLQRAWSAYNVAVQAPDPNADIIHSDDLYFIDATGHERYVAVPTEDHTANGTAYLPAAQVHQWGVDIASVARQLIS